MLQNAMEMFARQLVLNYRLCSNTGATKGYRMFKPAKLLGHFIVLAIFLAAPMVAHAAEDCLNIDIQNQEYPVARDKLISAGWKPKYFSPPFENAPFAEWVKTRNYAEVEACSPTGKALCRFSFTSSSAEGSELSVFTEGEDIGIVTGHQCVGSDQTGDQTDRESMTRPPVKVTKRWVRQSAPDLYVAKVFDYERSFDFRVHCTGSQNNSEKNSLYLMVGQDVYAGEADFSFANGAKYKFAFDDDGYALVDDTEKAQAFDRLISDLRSQRSFVVRYGDAPPYDVGLRGSGKAIGACPARVSRSQPAEKVSSSPEMISETEAAQIEEKNLPKPVPPFDAKNIPTDTYHQIENCEKIRGAMIVGYTSYSLMRGWSELSDVCVDREEGSFVGSESMKELTLVSVRDGFYQYEDIPSGEQDYERHSMWITDDLKSDGTKNENWSSTFSFKTNRHFVPRRFKKSLVGGSGYILNNTHPLAESKDDMKVHMHVSFALPRIGLDRGVCQTPAPAYTSGEPSSAAFEGQIDLKSGEAVQLEADESGSRKSEAILSLKTTEAGEITGTAEVQIYNPRLAGYGPCEWVSAKATIERIVGSTNGLDGDGFIGIGIGKGTFTDVHGDTYELRATTNLGGHSSSAETVNSDTVQAQDADELLIEKNLDLLGFDPGAVDGVFTEDTRVAVRKFQERYGFKEQMPMSEDQVTALKALVSAKEDN